MYLDPPYNHRQYAPNYHILETIARYDNPKIRGKTGLRDYSQQKSDFCQKGKVINAFENLISQAKTKYFFNITELVWARNFVDGCQIDIFEDETKRVFLNSVTINYNKTT